MHHTTPVKPSLSHGMMATPTGSGKGFWLRALSAELRIELLKLWRQPEYVLPAIGFPLAFYLLFGVMFGGRTGTGQAQYLLATYGAFGVIGATMFALGVGFSQERSQGWLQLRRLAPASINSLLLSKLVAAMVFAGVVVLLLMFAAHFLGSVRMPMAQWSLLLLVLLLASIPFALFGCCFGLTLSAKSAPNVLNLLLLPMAALGGLWFPLFMFPKLMQQLAQFLPTYHIGQVALATIGRAQSEAWLSWVALAICTLLAWVWARYAWARQG